LLPHLSLDALLHILLKMRGAKMAAIVADELDGIPTAFGALDHHRAISPK